MIVWVILKIGDPVYFLLSSAWGSKQFCLLISEKDRAAPRTVTESLI